MNAYAPPIPYRPDLEQLEPEEAAQIAELESVFVRMAHTVAEREGRAHRAVHAKGHALLEAELQVEDGLPPELAQGLFARSGQYQAIVRFSSPPAEQLPDSVSTPRAIAIKVLGVEGPRAMGAEEAHTQDFLMVNGPAFTSPGVKGFLRSAKLLAATTERMPLTKQVISATLRGMERAVEAAGGESAKLKGLGGQPQVHPLGETYFTQVPFLYGPYIAKFSLAPISPSLLALHDRTLDGDADAQREAIAAVFDGLAEPVEWALRAQLCRDTTRMPIEDASVEWPEAESPHITVARLRVRPQPAWRDDASLREDALAFAPWHALAAHRPLGAINRARRVVMAASRAFRADFNRCPIHEPIA
ncbi:catalase family protein [Stenotrophomonas sp. HITSZ_GD]|uniref:catalase family protein n=1 Tax=Stenotrophomonas sp. HITSZ_GD TaxID=3037248 RepID=UPI00240DEE2F|nr:catalase family protein [Stenotrophomonas sp. HITSZ_GD]MDG2523857.1 catalase family protein [Stenotrophomonas sp. HITSZ_GD]